MELLNPTSIFAALSQPTRLEVFRMLIKAGDQGLAAGAIAENLAVKQNTMSANLSILLTSGLVRNERDGRSIRYYANFNTLKSLLTFLMEDCCGGRAELCQPLLDTMDFAQPESAGRNKKTQTLSP